MIELGTSSASTRKYVVLESRNGLSYNKFNANPFANQVNTQSEYESYSAYNDWVMDNWQGGITKEPEEGGSYFSETETRFKNKVFLNAPIRVVGGFLDGLENWEWPMITQEIAVGTAETYQRVGVGYVGAQLSVPSDYSDVWLFLKSDTNPLTIELRTDNLAGTVPGDTLRDSITLTPDAGRKGYFWWKADFTSSVLINTGNEEVYWVVYPGTGTMYLPVGGTTGEETYFKGYDDGGGSAWPDFPYHMYFAGHSGVGGANYQDATHFAGTTYVSTTGSLGRIASGTVEGVTGITNSYGGSSIEVFGGTLWMGHGGTSLSYLNSGGTLGEASTVGASLLYQYEGYLYAAKGADLYYTTDVVNWFGPFQVGPSDYSIRGLAGAEGQLYISTDEGLYYLAPGDIPVGVRRYDHIASTNGQYMKPGDDGALYIPMRNQLLRYDISGGMQDIWMQYTDGMPADILGDVKSVVFVYGQPWVAVTPPSTQDTPTIWAWNREGWHHVGTLPNGIGVTWMYFDADFNCVWIGTDDAFLCQIPLPSTGINPLYDPGGSYYHPTGWIEFDKFYGGTRRLNKDWESVTTFGEDYGGTANGKVVLYFKDENSTDWELLGTPTGDGSEIRWSDYTTRPNGKWVKLGALLSTNNSTVSPFVESLSTKHLPIIADRYGWSFTVVLDDLLQLPSGGTVGYTRDQQVSHLQTLIQQVTPVHFKDFDNTGYDVWIKDHSWDVNQYQYYNGTPDITWNVRLEIEMVKDDTT